MGENKLTTQLGPEARDVEIPSEPMDVGSKKILLLDDESEVSAILKEYLELHSYEVTAAKDGVEGLKKIMASDFDVILCDLLMPNLSGDMFYTAVERTKPHLCRRFLFMTGNRGDPKWEVFVWRIGGLVLFKPLDFQVLLESIQLVLKKVNPSRR